MVPNTGRCALMVVDMQNGFLRQGGSCERVGLPVRELQSAIEPCINLVAAARKSAIPIIYTRYVYRSDFLDGGLLACELMPALRDERALTNGSEDAEIVSELAPRPEDFVVDKNRPSAFYATQLETWLKGLKVEELVVCGVTTNCCVETTVRDASQRDYRTFIVDDAVAEFDEERHRVALKSMAMLFGYVVSSEQVVTAWGAMS